MATKREVADWLSTQICRNYHNFWNGHKRVQIFSEIRSLGGFLRHRKWRENWDARKIHSPLGFFCKDLTKIMIFSTNLWNFDTNVAKFCIKFYENFQISRIWHFVKLNAKCAYGLHISSCQFDLATRALFLRFLIDFSHKTSSETV